MSADNGVYVLRTAGPEYRVAELQAIENLCYDIKTGDMARDPQVLRINAETMFGKSKVFHTRDEAFAFAFKLADEICFHGGFLEYGVSEINLDTIDLR